jgi:hypothetical protein
LFHLAILNHKHSLFTVNEQLAFNNFKTFCFGDHRLHFQIFEEEKNWFNNPIYIYYITAQQTVPCVEIKQEPGTFPSNVKNALLEDQECPDYSKPNNFLMNGFTLIETIVK